MCIACMHNNENMIKMVRLTRYWLVQSLVPVFPFCRFCWRNLYRSLLVVKLAGPEMEIDNSQWNCGVDVTWLIHKGDLEFVACMFLATPIWILMKSANSENSSAEDEQRMLRTWDLLQRPVAEYLSPAYILLAFTDVAWNHYLDGWGGVQAF